MYLRRLNGPNLNVEELTNSVNTLLQSRVQPNIPVLQSISPTMLLAELLQLLLLLLAIAKQNMATQQLSMLYHTYRVPLAAFLQELVIYSILMEEWTRESIARMEKCMLANSPYNDPAVATRIMIYQHDSDGCLAAWGLCGCMLTRFSPVWLLPFTVL